MRLSWRMCAASLSVSTLLRLFQQPCRSTSVSWARPFHAKDLHLEFRRICVVLFYTVINRCKAAKTELFIEISAVKWDCQGYCICEWALRGVYVFCFFLLSDQADLHHHADLKKWRSGASVFLLTAPFTQTLVKCDDRSKRLAFFFFFFLFVQLVKRTTGPTASLTLNW